MTTQLAQDQLAGTWNLNATHSSAEFSVKYLVAAYRARFDDIDASLVDGQLSGAVRVASVSAKDEMLAGHLQAPDFFDAERYPELTFESSSIKIDGENVELDGQLTVKGITKPLHATGTVAGPVDDPMGNTRLGFTLEATIDRTDFGVDFNMDLPGGGKALSNEVKLLVILEFHKAV